jgi:Cu2+-exporting ATPase
VNLTGWTLNPMLGAAAMSLSSVCVCMNALRLNLFDIHSTRRDKIIKTKAVETEEQEMEKTMNIEGMMCMHCEATVKKALEAIEGVEAAEVSHEQDKAVVTLNADVADDVLKNAVEAKDYTVISIE